MFKFLPLGAIIQSFYVNGINIVQGFPKQEHYEIANTPFYGETIGRVANRIAGAKIESLNGKTVFLAKNDGENTLHGGNVGWGKKVWDGPKPVAMRRIPGIEKLVDGKSIEFTLRDPSGNEGFPGTLEVSVVYTVGIQEMEDGREVRVLAIEYQAVMSDDENVQETVVNITNHSYVALPFKRI
jgi:aldose 1-epimerase